MIRALFPLPLNLPLLGKAALKKILLRLKFPYRIFTNSCNCMLFLHTTYLFTYYMHSATTAFCRGVVAE